MQVPLIVLFVSFQTIAGICSPRISEDFSCDQLIYIFVNPTSGGNEASTFMRTGVDYYHFGEPGHVSHVYISDIREGSRGNKAGFKKLASDTDSNVCVSTDSPVRIVVAGGDGTVVWAMQEALEHNVDMEKVAFAAIPYGTGNDFGRVFGWGASSPQNLFNDEMSAFKNLVQNWLNAEVIDFDLWEVQLEVGRHGRIRKWKNQSTSIIRNKQGKPVKTMIKTMSNYFSIGVESAIGVQFDRQRTGSRTINKGIYMIEGIKHMFKSISRVTDAVSELTSGDRLVFTTEDKDENLPSLSGDPVSLIFLNINSFAGGCDMWADASTDGLDNHQPLSFSEPSPADGKLEVMTYQSLAGFGWEQLRRLYRFVPSYGKRVAQVDQDIHITFKKDVSVYAQVDGEFYNIDGPKRVTIRKKGRTNVLRKVVEEDDEDMDFF